ncbi:NAD-dependent epimerase/dehydratase family protein [Henriciella sp. AS95]|uniref:NAD-dependent epimerase/dehydratase family protein n=1 Tax=Henriciella sp. AS95 TaxID=3135782 RepID=UPI003174C184
MTKEKRILLVGGGGPTGPIIVNSLIAEGHEVSVMNTGRHPVEYDAPVERIIADPNFLEPVQDVVSGRYFDTVIASYGRLRFVAQALTGHVEHFIGVTSTFYPNWIDPPATMRPSSESGVERDWTATYLDEGGAMPPETPLDPVGKFGQRVVETDTALQWAHRHGDFIGTVLRYPKIYGPRQPGATEWSIIRRLLEGRERIIVPEGGFLLQSILYAENAARIVLAAVADPDASGGQIFNCADPEPITLRKWIRLIAETMGKTVDMVSAPAAIARPAWPYARWPLTIGHHILDTSNLNRLNYTPVTATTALRRTVEWYLEDPKERGTAVESQLRDTFSYDLEDRILAQLDKAKSEIEAMDFPEFDMSHYYAHPKSADDGKPSKETSA